MEAVRVSDDIELAEDPPVKIRLGLCEVCNYQKAQYTCPKCEVKTCCIKCLNIHKKELDCSGKRDKTKFIPIRQMTNMDFMSDYTFLEECTRYVADRKRDKLKTCTRYNKNLPAHLFKLRGAAHERKITLRFLLQVFTKHNQNTTMFDWKAKVIRWRVEWVFPNACMASFVDERCDENETLMKLLSRYIDATAECSDSDATMRKHLEFYQSRGPGAVRVLLKAEGIKRCKNRFYELNMQKTLCENLAGKTVVEFPSIYVMYDDAVNAFEVIDSDDDVDEETQLYKRELDAKYGGNKQKGDRLVESKKTNEEGQSSTANKLTKQKRLAERKSRHEAQAKEPRNLLFTDERAWDEVSSSSDSGAETEEDETGEVKTPKASA